MRSASKRYFKVTRVTSLLVVATAHSFWWIAPSAVAEEKTIESIQRDIGRKPLRFIAEVGWDKINNPQLYEQRMKAFRERMSYGRKYRNQLPQFKPYYGPHNMPGATNFQIPPSLGLPHNTPFAHTETRKLPFSDYLRALKERPLKDEPVNATIVRFVWLRDQNNVFCLRLEGERGNFPASLKGKRLQLTYSKERRKGLYTLPSVGFKSEQFEGMLKDVRGFEFWNLTKAVDKPNFEISVKSSYDVIDSDFSMPLEDMIIVEQWSGGQYRIGLTTSNDSSVKEFLSTQMRSAGLIPASDYDI